MQSGEMISSRALRCISDPDESTLNMLAHTDLGSFDRKRRGYRSDGSVVGGSDYCCMELRATEPRVMVLMFNQHGILQSHMRMLYETCFRGFESDKWHGTTTSVERVANKLVCMSYLPTGEMGIL